MAGGQRCRFWTLTCWLCVAAQTLVAGDAGADAFERQYLFEPLANEEGLAQNTVNALLQDSHGFVWIATQGGLHRFDGHELRVWQQRPEDPDSLPDSFVTGLIEDPAGWLWVGSNSGAIARLDLASGHVVVQRDAFADLEPALREVTAFTFEPDIGLWIGDHNGVVLLAQGADAARRVADFRDPATADAGRVLALALAAEGGVLAASSGGLWRVTADGHAHRMAGSPRRGFTSLLVTGEGITYAGGHDGVFRVEGERVVPVDLGDLMSPPAALAEDGDGRLWVGLFGHGLLRLERDGSGRPVRHDRYVPGSLPEDHITALMVDRSGMLWVGGFARGVSRTLAGGAAFTWLADRGGPGQPLLANNVRAVAEDASAALWLGLEGEGLKRLRPDRDAFDDFSPAVREALALAAGDALRIQAIAIDRQDQVWAGSTFGLVRLDPVHGTAWSIPVDPHREDALPDPDVRCLLHGEDGSLWIGGFRGGLSRMWPDGRRWAHYRHDPDDPATLSHDTVLALLQEPSGALWVGTLDGLNRLDPGTGEMLRLRHEPDNPHSLPGNLVRALHRDAARRLWVGTHSGLARLDHDGPDGTLFSHFQPPGRDFDNTVYGILEDAQGHLWLSTNRGILALDPDTGQFRSFGVRDGLQGLEFNGGALLARRDGRLAFGGIHGLTQFDPQRALADDYQPPVRVTSVKVGAQRTELVRGLPPPRLAIGHGDRVISFGFSALDYAAPRRSLYAWRMHGFDSEWNEASARREATYTNLPAGKYQLEVRASGRDGRWSPETASIELVVDPPWWSSLPMRAAYAALVALALFLLWRQARRRRRVRELYAAQLREREDRLKLALWGSGDEFWDWDVANNRFYRLGADQLLGFVETEQQMSSDDWRQRAVHPDDRERVERILADHLAGRSDFFESEHRIRKASGDWVWVRSRGKVVERDAEGRPLRLCGTARNITDSRRAERERRIAAEVIRSMSEGVSVIDLDFRFVSVNPAFTHITGYSAEEVLGEDASILNGPQHTAEEYRQIRHDMERSGHWHGEMWQRRKDGEDILCWLESTEVRDANDTRTHYVAVLTDITDRKRAEQELRYLANYDTLTGLPNRTLLGERLAHAVIRARRQTTKIGVLFLDLDRFKHVNDSMGHAMGDRLLKAAGTRLRQTVRDTDTVARLGGDEFTVVLEDIHTVTQAERVAQKVLEAFAAPLELDGRQDVVISTSIGIALYPDHGQVPTDLLKFADTAMYQAKDRGRNTYQVYAETMDAEARMRATMVGALRRALDRGEFRLVYQPKLSLLDDTFTGVEALLRWDSEELGPIPPTTFIPLAEETGLIIAIGEWVLREACAQLLRWDDAGLGHLNVAVNVSVLQLFRGELSLRLRAIVEEFGIAPERLELELTESMVMANAEQSINTLRSLKAIGVNLAIDDFGTGYSSLAYLKRLPIDTLKIDKEFVGDITTDPDDEAITATIIAMAHSLGLNVVAEGVETEEQLLYLREQRCDEVQGFWLSAPLEAERCTAFLLARHKAVLKRRRAART